MYNFEIIPDSSSDFTKTLRERFGINHLICGTVYHPDGHQSRADIDWENITPKEYYNSMKGRNILYKTATPQTGEIIETFESVLNEGKDILSVSLSSALSSTYEMCKKAAKELSLKYPDRKIICVDSLRYSSAFGLLITKACEKRDAGASLEETAEYLNEIKHCIHQMGPLDDLFFCVKTGRVTNFQALFGTLIGVNSLGDFSSKGLSTVVGKVKGKKTAIESTVEYIKRTIRNPEEQIIFIGHSDREETALTLKERIMNEIKPKEIIINPIGMSCGASIGPGLCAVFYLGDKITDKENDIFDEVLNSIKNK